MNQFLSDKIPHILSSMQNLFPEKTSVEEMFVLRNATIAVEEISATQFHLSFHLPIEDFDAVKSSIIGIESNLKLKAEIIFKWFAGPQVVSVKIVRGQPS